MGLLDSLQLLNQIQGDQSLLGGSPQGQNQGNSLDSLRQIVELMGSQKNQQIDKALQPRSQITDNPKNGTRAHGLAGWHELNPQAGAQQPSTMMQDTHKALAELQKHWIEQAKSGRPQVPQQQAAAPHMALPPQPMQHDGPPQYDQTGRDAMGLSGLIQSFNDAKASNPDWQNQGPGHGLSAPPVEEGRGFDPGRTPMMPQGAAPGGMPMPQQAGMPQMQPPTIQQLSDTKWQPPMQSNASGLQGLTNLVGAAGVAGGMGAQAVTDFATPFGQIAHNANQAVQGAQETTQALRAAGQINPASKILGGLLSAEGSANVAQGLGQEAAMASKAAAASRFAKVPLGLARLVGEGSKFAGAAEAAGEYAAPVQLAMMGLEAGRLIGDDKFRQQSTTDYNNLENTGALGRAWQGFSAPISTIYNTGKAVGDIHNATIGAMDSQDRLNVMVKNADAAKTYRKSLVQQGLSSKEIQKSMFLFRRDTQHR